MSILSPPDGLAQNDDFKQRHYEMKELYIDGRFLSQAITGVQRYARELIRAIEQVIQSESSYRIILLVPRNKNFMPLKLENIEVREISAPFGTLFWEQIQLPLLCAGKLLFCPCNVAPMLAPLLGTKLVVTVHDLSVFDVPENFSRSFRIWYKILLPWIFSSARLVLTDTQFQMDAMARRFPKSKDRLKLLSPGLNEIQAAPSWSLDSSLQNPYILFVGSISPRKNLYNLVNALRIVRKSHSIDLVVAGASSRHFSGSHLLAEPWMHLFEGLSDSQLGYLYKNAELFAFPSFYEGFGFPLLEAMAFGCPVISSNATCLPEVGGNGALYFNPNSPAEIASSIQKILNDPKLREDLQQNGFLRTQKFSWKNAAENFIKITKNL